MHWRESEHILQFTRLACPFPSLISTSLEHTDRESLAPGPASLLASYVSQGSLSHLKLKASLHKFHGRMPNIGVHPALGLKKASQTPSATCVHLSDDPCSPGLAQQTAQTPEVIFVCILAGINFFFEKYNLDHVPSV